MTTVHRATIMHRARTVPAWLWIFVLAGCGAPSSELAGDYELVERSSTRPCDAVPISEPIAEADRWFRFVDQDFPGGGTLVAYYPCAASGECEPVYDLARSYAREGERWETRLGVAIGPSPCRLRFSVRRLERVDAETIRITETRHEESLDALPSAECESDLAHHRGPSMPCESTIEWIARAH